MRPDTRSFYFDAVQRVIARIAGHLDDALDLDDLAREACLSPFHFHRVFRGMVGETPMEFVRRLRLERAAWQLARTDRPVTEVAFAAGYDAHASFTRAFRAHFGSSPTEFRALGPRAHHLAAPCGVHFDPAGSLAVFIPRDSGGHTMHVEITSQPARRLATVRHMGPYNQIGEAFARLGQQLGPAAGRLFASGSAMIALYHDAPDAVPVEQLRSDAAVDVPADFVLPAGLVEQQLPAGRYASTVHVGPYDQLGDAWARFMGEWLPASGERLAEGPAFERYLNDPRTTPPADRRTELCAPLA